MNLENLNWNKDYAKYIEYLISLKEEKYKNFNQKIVSTKYEMLGIRLPAIRKIAKKISSGDYQAFLKNSKKDYYEEVLIQGLVIASIKELPELMNYFFAYLSLIDNWAITDSFCNSLKIVKKNKSYFQSIIAKLLQSSQEYEIRVGLIILLNFYIETEYLSYIFNLLDNLKSDLYYVNMAEAWLLCEIFTKYPEETLIYLNTNHLNSFTINKTVSKIRDSYRIPKEMKDYILKFKRK